MDESDGRENRANQVQCQIQETNSGECALGDKVPVRSTNQPHTKLFGGCVPLHGLRRSASSPRHSPRTNTTVRVPPNGADQNSPEHTVDPTLALTIGAPDLWEREGSFKWRRVRPSATVHHTNSSATKPSYLGLKQKHTSLSDSNDLSRSSGLSGSPVTPSTDTASVFRDPMLEELDSDLPVPPVPPPRAFPSWLKLALVKQRTQVSSPLSPLRDFQNSSSRFACSQTSVVSTPTLSGLDKPKSCSLDHDRYGLRIYPVMQNGVKISDTHYWLLDPPQSLSARYHTERLKYPSAENPWTPSSPTCSEFGDYLNVPAGVNLRREKSEPSRQALNNIHHQMALRLLEQVPEATEAECQAVLIGTSYQYDEAMRRLKLELLCRKDYLSRSHCKRLLHSCDWDLPRATNRARLEYEARRVRRLGRDEIGLNPTTEQRLQSPPPPRTGCTLDVLQLPRSPISPDLPNSPDPFNTRNPFFNNSSSNINNNNNTNTNPFLTEGQ